MVEKKITSRPLSGDSYLGQRRVHGCRGWEANLRHISLRSSKAPCRDNVLWEGFLWADAGVLGAVGISKLCQPWQIRERISRTPCYLSFWCYHVATALSKPTANFFLCRWNGIRANINIWFGARPWSPVAQVGWTWRTDNGSDIGNMGQISTTFLPNDLTGWDKGRPALSRHGRTNRETDSRDDSWKSSH